MREGEEFPMVPLRLFKQRLTAAARRGVCEVAGATHIVGDEALDVPDMAEGPQEAETSPTLGETSPTLWWCSRDIWIGCKTVSTCFLRREAARSGCQSW